MRLLRTFSGGGLCVVLFALISSLVCVGCRSTNDIPFSSDVPGGTPGGAGTNPMEVGYRFAVGDQLMVIMTGPEPPLAPHDERITEDGTITMNLIGAIKAAGKTAGELQKEIQDRYVPKYYTRLNVTVTAKNLLYSVGGEVKREGPQEYTGETTLTKALQAAGGFTDFANRKKIRLTRGGKSTFYNWYKLQEKPELDPIIIPGDRIDVRRKIF